LVVCQSAPSASAAQIDRIGRERPATLGGEHEGAVGGLPAQLAQRSHLVAAQRMRRRLAVLRSADVQRGGAAEFDLRPFQVRDLAARRPWR
jgi:hypothetical protein